MTRKASTDRRVLLCLLVILVVAGLPDAALAFDLRAPATVSVQVNGENATTPTERASIVDGFLQAEPLADFSCPQGHIVREMRVQSPHDWVQYLAGRSRARTLSNRTMPTVRLVSVPAMLRACVAGQKFLDVRVTLSTVCADRSKGTFAEAIRTDRSTQNVRVNLYCAMPTAPRHVPATAVPSSFTHDCSDAPGGIEGRGEARRESSSAYPLQCGAAFDPEKPHYSKTTVYRSKHSCEPGWLLDGLARHTSIFDRLNAPAMSAFGQVRWCHQRIDPAGRFTLPATVTAGAMRANLLAAEPHVTVQREAAFSFVSHPAPAPPGLPVCKSAEFVLSDEDGPFQVPEVGDYSCNASVRNILVSLDRTRARSAAARACVNEAARLKQENLWHSLPDAATGKRFDVTTSIPFDIVGRYCFGAEKPKGDNFQYFVDCGEREYQSEWGKATSVEVVVNCRAK